MSKFCTNCGQELNEDTNFCINCGKKVNESNEVKESVNQNNIGNNSDKKSKIAAGLLGIFLGSLGIHNFYLGYTGKAVGQLLISILSCGALSFVSGVWGLVEGILILTGSINQDANGNPLGE
ncbi:MAG: NINE protein [Bacilli bacterium]|nr:NINE protein [Bacilli bacterium]